MKGNLERKRKPSLWVTLIWAASLILVGLYAANSHSSLGHLLRVILSPYHN